MVVENSVDEPSLRVQFKTHRTNNPKPDILDFTFPMQVSFGNKKHNYQIAFVFILTQYNEILTFSKSSLGLHERIDGEGSVPWTRCVIVLR